MANVSEQVQPQNLSPSLEPLPPIDEKFDLEQIASWEALADLVEGSLAQVISSEVVDQDQSEDEAERLEVAEFEVLPNFINPPSLNVNQNFERILIPASLDLALANQNLTIVTDVIDLSALITWFQAHEGTKFWVDADIYSFTDFARWAIAHLTTSEKLLITPDHHLIATLVDLIQAHPCLIVITKIDQSSQREFWLDFLQVSQDIASQSTSKITSKIIVTSCHSLKSELALIPELKLSESLSPSLAADFLSAKGILGDRQDLETFGQLVGGNLLSLTLAASLLKTEEQIPQIRYLARYGKIFDLSYSQSHGNNKAIAPRQVFERSFKRLLPKLRQLLIYASIYRHPFYIQDMQGIWAFESNGESIEITELQKLEKLGLLRQLGQNYFYCEPHIREFITIADAKPYHEQIIKYLWTQTKPYVEWESDQDIQPYVGIFEHCCALGEYYRGFYLIQDGTNQCVDKYLDSEGKYIQRISLLQPLLSAWQEIKSDRPEFGAVLMGLGNAYTALQKYAQAIPLFQLWLDILGKKNDPASQPDRAQCLYALASVLAKNNPELWSQVLAYYQESLEIAVKLGDRSLELQNLLGIGNLYARQGEYIHSLEYYERYLGLARELKDTQSQIHGLPMIADAYKQVKQYAKAIELARIHLNLIANQDKYQNLRANSLEHLAHTLQILGQYAEAKTNYQECLALEPDQLEQRGKCLIGLGICSDRLGQYKEAISYHQQALEIFTDHDLEPECLINLGNAHNSLGQYKEAVGLYDKALKLSLKTSDRHRQAKSLIGLGNVQTSLGKFVKAIQFYEQAWEVSLDHSEQKAIALRNLGNAYNTIGQYQEAMELYKQSLSIAKELGDLNQQAYCLHSLGQVLDQLGYYAQALKFYEQWIDLKKDMGDRSASLSSLNRSSNLSSLVNTKYAQAIEFHQQWIEIKRKMSDAKGEANSLGNLGNAFFAIGQYPQAIQAYQQCLEIARSISDRRSEASSLSGLGSAFFVLGQYTQAIELHARSLEIAQKIDDLMLQAKASSNLGRTYYTLGQYLPASEQYLRCLVLSQKIGNRQGEANALGDLGNTNYALGKYPQAIHFYQQWLHIAQEIGDRSQQGNAFGGLGNSHNALGQYSKAVEFYRQWLEVAQEISDRRSQANALAGLGNAYNALGDYTRAIEFHQQSLKLQKENSDRPTEIGTWTNFVETLEALEQKSLTANPYKSIDVQSSQQDDSAIQQLLEAGSTLSIQINPPIQKNKPRPSKNWFDSMLGKLGGKKP
ncbi:TPR repeat-containing protein [Synechococcus sp. PCC 7502]|uniref:tetratricopeptide repeat protein n=1 Tax=Synechococcus sp. PCC 7502 TaxID=1173263 RepID=UPI00029FAFEF|nr:tetratricopeptide repeat protein [Synechococcus sp. PCC 7502]AFY75280.1 TPR repeat-containing protein [Synechococcus sp. PCC 7502]